MKDTAASHDELLDLLRRRKEALGLSNDFVDEIGGLNKGYCDWILGPSRRRGLSKMTLDVLLQVLAVRIAIVEDLDQVRRMESRWEGRNKTYVKAWRGGLSAEAISRVMRQQGSAGGAARMSGTNRLVRSELGRKAGKASGVARRRKARLSRRAAAAASAQAAPTAGTTP